MAVFPWFPAVVLVDVVAIVGVSTSVYFLAL